MDTTAVSYSAESGMGAMFLELKLEDTNIFPDFTNLGLRAPTPQIFQRLCNGNELGRLLLVSDRSEAARGEWIPTDSSNTRKSTMFSEPGEFAKMSRHRTKQGLLCVYFFGTRNYGWVKPSAIMPFSNDLTSLKPARKYSPAMVQRAIAAMAEAKVVLDDTDDYQICFYDRM
ncbi:hypothetical protein P43SY_005977 [Pythium insidiosum]|uniref:PWWP domain-containing protein n=1 Tax=Pythium insidiosum TaxID=114742 RepID=A0AAD5LUI2_PYTIN|nr:hypothetical protein P43SY_005977 [Pythium insidiosum]